LKPSLSMFMGDIGSQEAIGVGTIFICLHTWHIIEVSNVLHVLHLTKNLMLVCKATQGTSNMELFHDHWMVKITKKDKRIFSIVIKWGLYIPLVREFPQHLSQPHCWL
jgi:hypothetical protein